MNRFRLGATVVSTVVGLDQFTKSIVLRTIDADDRVRLFGSLALVRRFNKGGAFSIGDNRGIFPWIVLVLVAGLTSWYFVRGIRASTSAALVAALGCMVGGALGNQLDRLFRGSGWNRGAVVDFVATGFWPVFNVADIALTCGAIAVGLLSFRETPKSNNTKSNNTVSVGEDPSDC